jgi:hypothetical protein
VALGQLRRLVTICGGHVKLFGLAIVIGFCFVSASAQTANDLSAKYGAAQQSYEIRPAIFITVKFAAAGSACEMRLEKRHLQSSGAIGDSTSLSPEEMKSIIKELVPPNERGNKAKVSGLSRISGAGGDTLEDYDNVSILYIDGTQPDSGTVAVIIRWKNRSCH